MGRVIQLTILAVLVSGPCASGQIASSIVGTWQVLRYEDRRPDGSITRPYGEHPRGYFIYDATGHLSIQIMRTPALKPFPGMRDGTGEGARYKEAFLCDVKYTHVATERDDDEV